MKIMSLLSLAICLVNISCSKQNETSDVPVRTVVTGKVINPVSREPTISLVVNRVGLGQEEINAPLDSSGNFKFDFQTYVPVDAWVAYRTNFLVLIRPGDSLYVEFDAREEDRPALLETIKFEGDGAEINRQASIFQRLYYASNLYVYGHEEPYRRLKKAFKIYEPVRFEAFADSTRAEGLAFLNDYIRQYKPDEFVKTWAGYSIQQDYYDVMSSYPDEHRKANVLKESEWYVPISYYDYFDVGRANEFGNGLQSGHAISGYLDQYLSYMWRLTRDELSDSEDRSQLAFDSICLYTIIKHTSPGLMREALLTRVFNNFIEYSEIGSFDRYRSIATDNIRIAFLSEPLFKRYEIANERIAKAETGDFHRVRTLDSFLNGIIARNQGKKVTYVDIWATWCGPCRDEFPFSMNLQQQFADSVEFVFICIESEENAFANTVKAFGLKGTHYFLDKVQSASLSNELMLDGVPHYILIDKNSKIVADGFRLRPSADETKDRIEQLIRG